MEKEKCGICKMEVKKPPVITKDGTCSECGKKLKMVEAEGRLEKEAAQIIF